MINVKNTLFLNGVQEVTGSNLVALAITTKVVSTISIT